MTNEREPDSEQLIERAQAGDTVARQRLLERHRGRLRQMVAVRLDPRLQPRVDPSDIVQDALVLANKRLDEFLTHRRVALYPWLRQFAWEELVKRHQFHMANKRNVRLEHRPSYSDDSLRHIAEQFAQSGSGPASLAIRAEMRERIREALSQLGDADREVLVLRYMEQLTSEESAEVLGCSAGAIRARLLRALQRLRAQFDHE